MNSSILEKIKEDVAFEINAKATEDKRISLARESILSKIRTLAEKAEEDILDLSEIAQECAHLSDEAAELYNILEDRRMEKLLAEMH